MVYKSKGLVLSGRDYTGSAEPPATILEDESREENDGAFLGAGEPDWVQLPSGLWVMNFDNANDYVTFGNILAFERTDPFSIEVWAKPSSVSLDTLVAKQDTAGNLYIGYHFYIHNTKLKLSMADDNGDALRVAGDTAILNNTRGHFVVTYDGSSTAAGLILYVNGAAETPDVEAEALASTMVSTTPLLLGDRGAHGTFYGGQMRPPKIWNRALPPEIVAARFQNGRHWFGI